MEIDQDYLEYVGQSSLALLAISAAYFVDPANLITFAALLVIPILYGYTAYISRDSFRPATLLSLVTVIFLPIGTIIGFIAVFIPISNVLISLFTSGTGFKNYSNATLLPMLFTGLILGSIVFGAAQAQPEIKNQIVDSFEEISAQQTSVIVDQSRLGSIQQNASRQIAESTGKNAVLLTRNYVLNETDFDRQTRSELDQAFMDAQEDIPGQMGDMAANQTAGLDVSDQASTAAANLIEANLGLIILMMAMTFYVINPFISILTAISAVLFEKINQQL
jgi:hypothetical protein